MLRQWNSRVSYHLQNEPAQVKKSHRKLYILFVGLAAIAVIAAALFVPPMLSNANYPVQEHLVYSITNVQTNQSANTSLAMTAVTNTQSYNSTQIVDIIGSNNENLTLKEKMTMTPNLLGNLPEITINVSKASHYTNFIAPGAPMIFYHSTTNDTTSTYLALQSAKVGDVWTIPVNTGNSSLGVTGEVTLTFAEAQDLTVPAGTFKVLQIEIASNTLNIHSDGSSIIHIADGMTLQLNGTSHIEQGTCLLIKAELTQTVNTNSPGIGNIGILETEKTLIEYSKP